MEHEKVVYVEPLDQIPRTMEELLLDSMEKCLAESAIQYFLDNPLWNDKDKKRCAVLWKRYGWSMFNWRYYRVSRAYLGGYKALSACLKLRRI